jgi:hypothetical protein
MKNKYYTPAIDEFYVGFEYEVAEIKSADLITGEQEHKIWVHKFYDQGDLIDLYYNYKPDFDSVTFNKTKLRVKYLDQEDIESLGFKHVGGKMVRDIMQEFCKNLGRLFIHLTYTKFSNHASIRIECSVLEYSEKTLVVHSIKIKNKSELSKLLKQLSINE